MWIVLAVLSAAIGPHPPHHGSGLVAVPGGALYYQFEGAGPAVVFLHDGLLDQTTWDHQIPAFARFFRTVRYDRRGFGRSKTTATEFSDLDDLTAVLDSLAISRAILVGCSSGGGLALDFALAHPERVTSLVLVGPVVSGFGYTEHFRRRGYRNHRGLFERSDTAAAIDAWATDPWLTLPGNIAARRFLRAGLTRHPASLSWGGPSSRPPPREAIGHLGEVRVPVLLVVGEGDIPDVHAHVGVIAAGIPGAEREVIGGAGHLAHIERPAIFNRRVLAFLRPAEEARDWVRVAVNQGLAARGAALLGYDPSAPLGIRESATETRGSVRVTDLTYQSPKGGPVPAYLVEPGTSGPHPGVVWVHHGQGDRKTFLEEAIKLAGRGAVSLLIDAPDVRPSASVPGRRPWDRVVDLRERIQGVVDVRRAFDLLVARPGVDSSRLAYVGYSLGATIGATLVGVESRPRGFVLMAGFPALTHVYGAEHHTRTSMAFQSLLPPADQRAWLRAMAPIDGIHQLGRSRAAFLLQFANRDEYLSRFDAEVFGAAVKAPGETQWYDTDHFGLGAVSETARTDWLIRLLGLAPRS